MNSLSCGSIVSRYTDDISKIERAVAVYESGRKLETGFAIYAQANVQLESKISELGKKLSQKGSADPIIQMHQELVVRHKKLSDRVSAIVLKDVPSELQRAIREDDVKQATAILTLNKTTSLPNGEMPLVYAIRCGSYETVKSLLDRVGLDTSAKDHQNLTPIDHAFLSQDQRMIHLLLQSALGVKHPDIEGLDLIHKNELSLISEKFMLFRNVPIAKLPPAFQSAYLGELEEVKKFLKSKDFDMNARMGSLGITLLHLAVLGGQEAVVKHLLQAGAKLLLLNDGQTLLHLAVMSGNKNVLQLLLERKQIDPNLPNQEGITPLHCAILAQNSEATELLIRSGANPFVQTMKTTPYAIFMAVFKESALQRNPLGKDWFAILSSALHAGASALDLSADYWRSPMMHTASQIGYLAPTCLTIGASSLRKVVSNSWLARGIFGGTGILFALFPNEAKIAAQVFPVYSIGASAARGIAACWKNRHVERLGPLLLNAGLHMFNVSAAINRLWWALDVKANRELELKWGQIQEDIDVFGPARKKLGLKAGFTEKECKSAYRAAIKKAHPDKYTGDSDEALLVRKSFDDLEKCSYPNISYDVCADKTTSECLNLRQSNMQYLLNPKYPRHARIILGLNYGHSLPALVQVYNQKIQELGTARVDQHMINRLQEALYTLVPQSSQIDKP